MSKNLWWKILHRGAPGSSLAAIYPLKEKIALGLDLRGGVSCRSTPASIVTPPIWRRRGWGRR
jgi:hypothetical protein